MLRSSRVRGAGPGEMGIGIVRVRRAVPSRSGDGRGSDRDRADVGGAGPGECGIGPGGPRRGRPRTGTSGAGQSRWGTTSVLAPESRTTGATLPPHSTVALPASESTVTVFTEQT